MKPEIRLPLGSAMAGVGAVIMVLGPVLGWTDAPRPRDFLLGFLADVLAGAGVSLAIAGLKGFRRNR